MQPFEHVIKPGVGIGSLLLGSTKSDARALLGEPTSIHFLNYGDDIEMEEWCYEEMKLELAFAEDDEYRLGAIETRDPSATLHGDPIIGILESVLNQGTFGGMGPPNLDSETEDIGRLYGWDTMLVVCNGPLEVDLTVVAVSVMPIYDEAGEIPQWPTP